MCSVIKLKNASYDDEGNVYYKGERYQWKVKPKILPVSRRFYLSGMHLKLDTLCDGKDCGNATHTTYATYVMQDALIGDHYHLCIKCLVKFASALQEEITFPTTGVLAWIDDEEV